MPASQSRPDPIPSHRAPIPIAGPSQPRRATTTCLSIDRTRRPVSPRQRANRPLEPRDRPRTPGLAPSKADPRRHPPRDRTPKARSIRRTRPRSIDPIDVERELRSRNVSSIPKPSSSPRCGAPPIPSRIASAVESAPSSAHPRCRGAVASGTGRRTGRGGAVGQQGVWGTGGRRGGVGCGCAAGCACRGSG